MENLTVLIQTIIGFAALGAGFKGADWLISLKYMTKDECTACREKVKESHDNDKERIVRIETKIDMLLGCASINNNKE